MTKTLLILLLTTTTTTQATPLEYGTCGLTPTAHFESQGFTPPYIIYETFLHKHEDKEIFQVEIVRPQGNTEFLTCKYELTITPPTCTIEHIKSLL